jgi:hypothetical protein
MDLLPSLCLAVLTAAPAPSRPAEKGCSWEKLSDTTLGLFAWVQRCDFGFRKVDLLARGHSLLIRYSDAGDAPPEPLIDVFPLQPGESAEAGIGRIYASRTPAPVARRCRIEPWAGTAPSGVKRYQLVPDPAYRKELEAKASPDEVPEPPCGELGEWPDGVAYWEAQSGAARVMFVRAGQDAPLFDEQTLRLLPAK